MNLSLPPNLKKWVDRQVQEGDYGTASEYLRDLLRRAREREARRQIDALLVEAVESGANIEMDDADWASIRQAARSAVKPAASRKGKP